MFDGTLSINTILIAVLVAVVTAITILSLVGRSLRDPVASRTARDAAALHPVAYSATQAAVKPAVQLHAELQPTICSERLPGVFFVPRL